MKLTFKRRAFTLIELLIVIAIIGILFIVLVSKVDFATDKAKMSGVQTDFRSFQVAFEQVSRENAGFNTLGWDMGDIKRADFDTALAGYTYTNEAKDAGDRVRNSYDKGDLNLNGECDSNETFTGRKIYTETWTGIYTLDNPGDAADKSAYILLEEAINKNLDPKLQLTINPDAKTFSMKNGYQDPWKTEYHGFYLSNANVDGKDRGAILMYSDGPNKVFGSAQTIVNGVVSITVPQNNIQGQDDLSILTIYTYFNGYGENKTTTTGFSQNQSFLAGGNGNNSVVNPSEPGSQTIVPVQSSLNDYSWSDLKTLAQANLSADELKNTYNIKLGDYKSDNGKSCVLVDLDGNSYDGFVFMVGGFSCQLNDNVADDYGLMYGPNQALQYSAQNALTLDLIENAKTVNVSYNKIGVDNGCNTKQYKFFLPAMIEINPDVQSTFTYWRDLAQEGETFDYFLAKKEEYGSLGFTWSSFFGVIETSSYSWLRSYNDDPSVSGCYFAVNGSGGFTSLKVDPFTGAYAKLVFVIG